MGRPHPRFLVATLCQAHIEEGKGNLDKAVDQYLEAVALGDIEPRRLARLVQLLVGFKRFPDAQEVLDRAGERVPLPPELIRVGADIALANQNSQEALRLAARAVGPTSKDYRDYLWLGRIYHRAGADPKAEEALRQSVVLAPNTPDTWIALVEQLARIGKREEAEALARTAGTKVSPRLALFTEGALASRPSVWSRRRRAFLSTGHGPGCGRFHPSGPRRRFFSPYRPIRKGPTVSDSFAQAGQRGAVWITLLAPAATWPLSWPLKEVEALLKPWP